MNNNVLGEEANDTSDGFALNRFPLLNYSTILIYLFIQWSRNHNECNNRSLLPAVVIIFKNCQQQIVI